MYLCIIICVCVCRWYKQPTTGHPGREAVLLTVRTAHELCSFLPWAGAVSCVSWTCNRGTTEGEWEHFILLNLILNPSWEWGQSFFSLIPNGNEASLASASFSTHPLKVVWVPATDNIICLLCRLWQKCTQLSVTWQNTWVYSLNNSCYLESQHKLSSFMCVCTNLCSFLPVTYSLNCKCGLVGTCTSTPSCMNVCSWWLNLFSVLQYISIFGQLSHIIPTFKKMVSWCHWAMLSTASSTIDHLQVEMVGTHLSQQVYSLVNYVQVCMINATKLSQGVCGLLFKYSLTLKSHLTVCIVRFHLLTDLQSFLRT